MHRALLERLSWHGIVGHAPVSGRGLRSRAPELLEETGEERQGGQFLFHATHGTSGKPPDRSPGRTSLMTPLPAPTRAPSPMVR